KHFRGRNRSAVSEHRCCSAGTGGRAGGVSGWEWRHFNSRLDDARSVLRMPGLSSALRPGGSLREGLAFSPDGKWGASGSPDAGLVGVWNTATGRVTGVLDTQGRYLNDMAFLRDGRLLTFSGDGTLRSWNLSQNEASILLRISDPSISGQLLSPDGGMLMCV